METKEMKVIAPEGYEIDKENSTFEKIVFKKKSNGKPRTWEEFCKRGFTGKEAYISVRGVVKSFHDKGDSRTTDVIGYIDNVEEAEAFRALMQLRLLRKAWVGEWESDWQNGYCIAIYQNEISTFKDCINSALSFPTEEIAKEFLECFRDLIEQAKILL